MLEKCKIISDEISALDILNGTTVSNAITDITKSSVTRILITDQNCQVIYDSMDKENAASKYTIFPQITQALKGNDVFSWQYRGGAMQSHAAMPIYSYGTLVGCVYLMELDNEQGALIASLQGNIFTITLILEIAVIVFSVWFSTAYSRRFRKIMTSIHTVRAGDYSLKLEIGGHDELTMLGDAFNDLTSRLQVSESKRRQFVSDASHELKTPLASIKLLSDSILQNAMDLETTREFVSDIGDEAERLNRMSQKLLALARIESQPEGNFEIVSIAPTVQKVVRMLTVIAADHKVEIIQDLSADRPILILEDDLYQIIFNLAENGIKYNRPGGKLYITLMSVDDNAVISIKDTGVGIPEDSLSHIFERFYRVDKARSRSTGGSGLGLSIVRNMVERNRGTIRVESSVGKGTTFTVSFPIFDVEEE